MNSLLSLLGYSALPVAGSAMGALAAAWREPTPKWRSAIQHLAAGVIFSVVAVEILPDVTHKTKPLFVAIGFSLGVLAMLLLRVGTRKAKGDDKGNSPGTLLGAIAVDVFIDGFLLGIGFATGQRQGILLTLALTAEFLSVGLALFVTLSAGRVRRVLTVVAVASFIFLGSLSGALLLRSLPGSATQCILSFGIAALLFLVTEELLVEAHEAPETLLGTSAFFAGFLLFLILGMAGG